LFQQAKELEPIFEEAIHSLKGENQVVDIRNIGLMGAVHFGSDPIPATEFASKVFQHCYENDVLVRFSGEFLVLSPSLIAEPEHIAIIVDALKAAIRSIN
jgi:beta-alanine--pyruvate transaminase